MFNVEYYDNDLFYMCSLIEFIGRETKNQRNVVVSKLNIDGLFWIYSNASVNHCLPLEQVCDECIVEYKIDSGVYDNLTDTDINNPSVWDVGNIYMRLILNTLDYEYVAKDADTNSNIRGLLEHSLEIYNSWIREYIDNYSNLVFTGSPQYHYACYEAGEMLD